MRGTNRIKHLSYKTMFFKALIQKGPLKQGDIYPNKGDKQLFIPTLLFYFNGRFSFSSFSCQIDTSQNKQRSDKGDDSQLFTQKSSRTYQGEKRIQINVIGRTYSPQLL